MMAFDDLREGLGQAWENLTEGWRELWRRAGQAMTRFQPPKPRGEGESQEAHLARLSPHWGLVPAEVHDENDRIVVRLEAPGLEPADFDIEVRGDMLLIRGEKQLTREERQGQYFLTERTHGRFEQAVPLPTGVDESGAKASYRRGVLAITLPKRESATVRRVQVRSE